MSLTIEATEAKSLINLEPGTYSARVAAVEPADGGFGSQVKLSFAVDGETTDDGEPLVLWAWASQKLNPKTKLWRFVGAITGSAPVKGQPFDVESLIGAPCRLQVGEVQTDDGPRIRVTDVLPPAKRAAKPQETAPGCTECFAELGSDGYFTPDGKPYCALHGPRGSEFK
jgi:hypothetical protein